MSNTQKQLDPNKKCLQLTITPAEHQHLHKLARTVLETSKATCTFTGMPDTHFMEIYLATVKLLDSVKVLEDEEPKEETAKE